MKEICDILGGRNIGLLWPLLHIFRGPDPLPQYLRPYWLRLCFRQTSAVFSKLASWLSAFQLNGHLMRFAIARARWSQISEVALHRVRLVVTSRVYLWTSENSCL